MHCCHSTYSRQCTSGDNIRRRMATSRQCTPQTYLRRPLWYPPGLPSCRKARDKCRIHQLSYRRPLRHRMRTNHSCKSQMRMLGQKVRLPRAHTPRSRMAYCLDPECTGANHLTKIASRTTYILNSETPSLAKLA